MPSNGLTSSRLTRRNGSSATSRAFAFSCSPYRFHAAPGNQDGTYFTKQADHEHCSQGTRTADARAGIESTRYFPGVNVPVTSRLRESSLSGHYTCNTGSRPMDSCTIYSAHLITSFRYIHPIRQHKHDSHEAPVGNSSQATEIQVSGKHTDAAPHEHLPSLRGTFS
jgi:hypothetical protein